MKTKRAFLCLLLALTTMLPFQSRAAEGPPVVSPPPELVLGNFGDFPISGVYYGDVPSMAYDSVSGKLFVSARHEILRFSPQAQLTYGGLPEAVFSLQNAAGLAVDSAGGLWAVSGNRVVRFDNAAFRPDAAAPDGVLGQPDFNSNTAGAGQTGMKSPKSLAVDPSGTLWVADTGNNRVLGFLNVAGKPDGAPADLLLGQPTWTNTGSGVAPGRMTEPAGMAADSTGRLWVVDNDTRVLRFDNAASKTSGAAADGVLGHSDFFGTLPEDPEARFVSIGVATDPAGTIYISTRSFNGITSNGILRWSSPWTKSDGAGPDDKFLPHIGYSPMGTPNGLGMGSGGSLWIMTPGSYQEGLGRNLMARVDSPATAEGTVTPDGVLGAADLALASPRMLANPRSVVEDPVSGKVFVADTGNSRVLRYASVKLLNSGASAEAVFGRGPTPAEQLGGPSSCTLDSSGNLWVSDTGKNRVLRFANAIHSPTGTPAVAVLGQPDFTTTTRRPPSEYTLNSPGPLAIGPGGELWVSEVIPEFGTYKNSRVVRFDEAATAASGSAASGVLGRVDFYDQQLPRSSSSTAFASVTSLFCEPSGRLWVMSNIGSWGSHYDLYRFDAAATKPNGAPAEASLRIHVAPAAGYVNPPGIGGPPTVLPPSFFIDADGGLMLLASISPYAIGDIFQQYDGYLLRFPNAEALPTLPTVIDQPSFVEYSLNLSGMAHELANALDLSPSADGFVWVADAVATVQRYKLPPFDTVPVEQQVSFELAPAAGGDVLALRFASIPGRDYQLYDSPDLTTWSPGEKLSATGTSSVFLRNPVPGNAFFKVVLLP